MRRSMVSLDLKLVLYIVVLLCVALCLLGGWAVTMHRRRKSSLLTLDVMLGEVLPFGMAITAADGCVLFINSRAQRLLAQLGDDERATMQERLARLISGSQT